MSDALRGAQPSAGALLAGVGRADITPPLPADLMGYVRRWRPARAVRAALSATTLIVEGEGQRLVIVCADAIGFTPAVADWIRAQTADAVGTEPDCVLLNASHSHATPYTGGTRHKLGGAMRTIHERERSYVEHLRHQIVSSAVLAAEHLQPARVGAATGSIDLAVNRRERTGAVRGTAGTLTTILGWNPDGPVDRDVGVLRVDHEDGRPLALVVNYACHPVVVGPEDDAVNPDFPGPMRDMVEEVTGATCLFLQGAGGNVLPLEGFFDEAGPEVAFGRQLATEALHAAASATTQETRIEKLDFASVTPIALYRRRPVRPDAPPVTRAAGTEVRFPLKGVPTLPELEAQLETYRVQHADAQARGAGPEILNPIDYHVLWAEEAIETVRSGQAYDSVPAFLQALRIGDVVIAAVPGEVFSEIALAIKERSPLGADRTLFAGYSNGVISYLPCAAEYPFGGYEVDYAHHSYGLIEQVAPETESVIVEACLKLLEEIAR